MEMVNRSVTPSRALRFRPGPALTLVFLAPFISEVLSGATRLSYIIAFVPEMLVWGCGALLAREIVRRWHAGWPSLLLLGLGLSVAEEFLIQQTSVAPLPWAGASANYGRIWGVNWIYFLFMLVYESVLVVLVPVQISELAFRKRRDFLWLTVWRIIRATWLFVVGSFMAYYGWVRRARPMFLHVPLYTPPAATLAAGTAAILLLVTLAYLVRGTGRTRIESRKSPSPWLVGVAVLAAGFPWYLLLKAVFSPSLRPSFSFWWDIAAGIVWVCLIFLLFQRWTSAADWDDLHGWAACFAAMVVCIMAGFLGSSTWLRRDVYFKTVVDVLAIVWMVSLLGRLRTSRGIKRRQREWPKPALIARSPIARRQD